MRTIKFRGMKIVMNTWLYFDLKKYCESDEEESNPFLEYVLKNITEFSGFTDKNKKEIYEGDILSEKWKVEVYKDVTGALMVKFHNNPKMNKTETLNDYLKLREKAGTSERDCVIIGNIFDNPYLLIS